MCRGNGERVTTTTNDKVDGERKNKKNCSPSSPMEDWLFSPTRSEEPTVGDPILYRRDENTPFPRYAIPPPNPPSSCFIPLVGIVPTSSAVTRVPV